MRESSVAHSSAQSPTHWALTPTVLPFALKYLPAQNRPIITHCKNITKNHLLPRSYGLCNISRVRPQYFARFSTVVLTILTSRTTMEINENCHVILCGPFDCLINIIRTTINVRFTFFNVPISLKHKNIHKPIKLTLNNGLKRSLGYHTYQ